MTRPIPRPFRHGRTLLFRLGASMVAAVLLIGMPVASPPSPSDKPTVVGRALDFIRPAQGKGPWIAKALSTRTEFRLAGVSWSRSDRVPGHAEIRTSPDGRSWSPWTELEVYDAGPDRGSREDRGVDATEPIWVGRARHAQVRWVEGGEPPESIRFHGVNPGSDPSSPSASAKAAPGRPGIISRAEWGANESIRRCCPAYAPSVDYAVVHHTATTNNYGPGDSAAMVRSVYEYHVNVNRWDDIGYHFVVDRFGRVFEGRAGGVTEPVIGAHSAGFNRGSTGIALLGSFQSTDPPGATVQSLIDLLAWKLDIHHVDPRGSTTVVSGGSDRHAPGAHVQVAHVAAHRDLQATSCPGDRVMSRLGMLRSEAYARGLPKIFRPSTWPGIFAPGGGGESTTLRILGSASDGATWHARVRNAAGAEVRSWSGGGNIDLRWDGRNAAGAAMPHGYYNVRIDASGAGGGATPAQMTTGLYRDPWGNWTTAGTLLDVAGAPQVATTPDGHAHMVARGRSGGIFYYRWAGNSWSSPRRLGTTNDVAASDGRLGFASDPSGVLHVVIRGRSQSVFHGRILTNGNFVGWTRIGTPNDRGTDFAIAASPTGPVHVVLVGMSGRIFTSRWTGSWTGWHRIGGGDDMGTQPAVGARRGGELLAVIRGNSGAIWGNGFDPIRGWDARWSQVGAQRGVGSEPTVAGLDDRFVVVVRGQSSPNLWDTSGGIGSWVPWVRIGTPSNQGFTPATTTVRGDVVLAVRGNSGGIHANVRAPDGGWRGFHRVAGSQQGAFPTIAGTTSGVVVAVEVSNSAPSSVIGAPPLRAR